MLVEAEVCESPSILFHGLCFSDANCGKICSQEGFISGHCKGIKLRCICFKDCGGPTKPPKVNPPTTPPTGCPNPPAGGCPKPPVVPAPKPPKPPVVPVPKPPVIPVPSPPTGCPNPPSTPGYNPPTGCPNPPSGCRKPAGGC